MNKNDAKFYAEQMRVYFEVKVKYHSEPYDVHVELLKHAEELCEYLTPQSMKGKFIYAHKNIKNTY